MSNKRMRKLPTTFAPGNTLLVDLAVTKDDSFLDGLLCSIAGELLADLPADAPEPMTYDMKRATWTCAITAWPRVLTMLQKTNVHVSGYPADFVAMNAATGDTPREQIDNAGLPPARGEVALAMALEGNAQ